MRRLVDKIRSNADEIVRFEEDEHRRRRRRRRLLRHHLARRPRWASSWPARRASRSGFLRLIMVWPFPEKRIRELAGQGQGLRGAGDQLRPDGPRGRALRRRDRPPRSWCPTPAAACTTPRTSATRSWGRRNEHGERTKPTSRATSEHPIAPFLRMDRMPHIWCPDLRHRHRGQVLRHAPSRRPRSTWTRSSIVSGIGCTGRVAGYMKLDAFHTTHGRAIPFATGPQAGPARAAGDRLLRRRRPVGHRRQPLHPRRAAQHGPAR